MWTKIRDASGQQEALTSDLMARKTSPNHTPNKEDLTQDTTNTGLCKGKRIWCCVCSAKSERNKTKIQVSRKQYVLASVGECEKLKVKTHSTICRLSWLLHAEVRSTHRRRHSSTREEYAGIMTWYGGDHSILQHRTFIP